MHLGAFALMANGKPMTRDPLSYYLLPITNQKQMAADGHFKFIIPSMNPPAFWRGDYFFGKEEKFRFLPDLLGIILLVLPSFIFQLV